MSVTVKAPRLGEGVEELTIGRWIAHEGDAVEENAPLVELESDKVVTELSSPAAGILLKALVAEGDVVRVGDPVAVVAGEEAAPAEEPVPEPPAPAAAELPRRFLSPLARKLAALHGVDPAAVRGTGLGGRVMKQDILDFAARRDAEGPRGELRPHSTARSRIAERMVESLRVSAQVLTVMEADMGEVVAHRAANKDSFAAEGLRLTLTAYFVAAAAAALRRHPRANASWSDDGLLIHPSVDIGLAVSLGEEGLLVPVVRNADALSLRDLARTIEDLSIRSRTRKLTPDEVRGGTFTLTNHGSSGSLFATPIIVQPQAGILGVGAVRKRAVVVEAPNGADALAIRPMAYLSFVFDHRVMDGEGADRFLAAVKDELERRR